MNEIKKILESDRLIVGKERTMKLLKKGELEKIYLASNTEKETKKDIEYYANLNKTEIINVNMTNDELGIFCKKPFSIAVMSLQK